MKSYLLGFLTALLVMGCSGFSYHYYGLDQVSYDRGNLLGPQASADLPFSSCSPRKCVVMFASDFFNFKQDYEDAKNRLVQCERDKKISP